LTTPKTEMAGVPILPPSIRNPQSAIRNSSRVPALAVALFFLSGAAGLAYEVVWFKRLSHVWGSSAIALAAVLASYLLGLGAGAGVVGRVADRIRRPLLWYGGMEVAIGVLSYLVPPGIHLLESLTGALHPVLVDRPFLYGLTRCALSFLVLGPPCFLMGGTFPLVVKQFTPPGGALRDSSGILYAANTLGGAAGAYLAGFHLLPGLGLPATSAAASLANFAAGVAAMAWALLLPEAGAPAALSPSQSIEAVPSMAPAAEGPPGLRLILLAALLSGTASLALQVAWTRQLMLVLGASTYAFTAMLFSVILGIGLGGVVYHLWLRERVSPRRIQALVGLALLVSALAGQLALEDLCRFAGAAKSLRAGQGWNALISIAASSAVELIPALGMGILLPLYIAASGRGPADAGRAAGDIYAWNTAGAIGGAVGAALYILPHWGVSATVAAALALYLAAALLLAPSSSRGEKLALPALAIVGAGAILLTLRGPDPLMTNLGLFLYGDLAPELVERDVKPLYFREGVSSNVLVTAQEGGTISLRVNGKVDASNYLDMPMQLGTAYFPLFHRPEARDVLVIGMGSGCTVGGALLFPETHVTCAELEPGIIEATRCFASVNHLPFDPLRFRAALDDGRSYLQGAAERFDLILSEPSNPWIAGVANLYTREYYRTARSRLKPEGILAQWIQSYALSAVEYALVVRTVLDVFPHGALIRLSQADTILLASDSPLDPESAALDRAQGVVDSIPPLKADLQKYFDSADVRSLLISRRVLAEDGLRRLIEREGGRTIHTDQDLRLEFAAPLRLFQSIRPAAKVQKLVLQSASAAAVTASWERWRCGRSHLPALRQLLDLFADYEEWQSAQDLIEFGLRIDPEEPYFLAARFMSAIPEDEKDWDAALARIQKLSPEDAARVGAWLHIRRDPRALRVWRRLIDAFPQAATLWVNLASTLAANGRGEEARQALEKARALDPFSSFVQSQVENVREQDRSRAIAGSQAEEARK
jgi:spermidine synthase